MLEKSGEVSIVLVMEGEASETGRKFCKIGQGHFIDIL
jgi:hypothetical protein